MPHNSSRFRSSRLSSQEDEDDIYFQTQNPTAHFVGRQSELESIRSLLMKQKRLCSVALFGPGGIGKTELAKKYVEQYKSYYERIIWIDAETPSGLEQSFRSLCCDYMDVRNTVTIENETTQRNLQSVISDFYIDCEDDPRETLFVFDNCDGYMKIYKYLPPNSLLVHMLITSRDRAWEFKDMHAIKLLEIAEFTPEEAVEYMESVLRINYDVESLNELVDIFNCFPLALRQSADYINKMNKRRTFTVGDYLQEYSDDEKAMDLLDFKIDDNSYPKTLFTTWERTLTFLSGKERYGKGTMEVLQVLTYCAPEYTPKKILLGKMKRSTGIVGEALNLLYKHGFISWTVDGVKMRNTLVQRIIRLNFKRNKSETEVLDRVLDLIDWTSKEPVMRKNFSAIWSQACQHSSLIDKFDFGSENSGTPLEWLSEIGDVEGVEKISKYLWSNQRKCLSEKVGTDALLTACKKGYLDIVKLLLGYGSDPDRCDVNGETALKHAGEAGHTEIVNFLLSIKLNDNK